MLKKKGVTLVSLVVTVIVLLVLAGIILSLTIRRERNIEYSKNNRKKLY